MSEAEHPSRLQGERRITIDDVRQLMGASTPHFALQLRNRIDKLIRDLPADHPARVEGEREIARLDRLAFAGEQRGGAPQDGELSLPSLTDNGDKAPDQAGAPPVTHEEAVSSDRTS